MTQEEPWESSLTLQEKAQYKGYIKGNVIVLSYRANVIKNSGSSSDHRKIAEWMEKHGL